MSIIRKHRNSMAIALALGLGTGCMVPQDETRYVDSFDLTGAVSGYGAKTLACKSVAGNPLTLKGKVYVRGFGDHPESALAFRANGKVTAFDALVGLDDDSVAAAKGMTPESVARQSLENGKRLFGI